jgi:hypothetical protein
MEDWFDFEESEPPKIYGNTYWFCIELHSGKTEKIKDYVRVTWKDNDWYLLDYENIEGFESMSGIEYFKKNKIKYWRVYKASNEG